MRWYLNGWLRLWIVVTTIGFLATAALAVLTMPTAESTSHEASFDAQLTPEALAQRAEPNDTTATHVKMPNDHTIALKGSIEARRTTPLLAEYVAVLERVAVERRRTHLVHHALWWVLSSVSVLLLGVAVAWVRRGFAKSKSAV